MTGFTLRESFLRYFEQHSHTRVSSSSLVPTGDATLLFTNAGMVQFKNIFTGEESRSYRRATTAQKCLRVSGKHNDLENVGYTARHHTFFEMLGNFSFGDYFKEDAIAFGWEFLTKQVGLPKDLLHVTVYQDDDEAERIWKKILGPQANPITRLGEKDNFWSMGETGPCGPCSEIHIDQGERFGCGTVSCGPGCDCDRFLELWNLVFMQFYRDEHGSMTPLPRPSIDTGLGLERLAAVVQGVDSNWETDLFEPIIQRIRELSGVDCTDHDHRHRTATRVIADHSRSAAFLVADGVLPSNEGRGYVLRRILRRALRFGKSLGLEKPFLHDSAGVVVDLMSDAYPELETHRVLMTKVIRSEEERFIETLARGLTLFEEVAANLKKKNQTMVSGDVVFRLYDTYGFPRDLTEDLAREAGFSLDHEGFETEMSRQRVMARQAWEGMHDGEAAIWRKLLPEKVVTQFSGYTTLTDIATVMAIKKDDALVQKAQAGDSVELILDRTPFYGESGGQVGDHGMINSQDCRIEVMDTIKPQPDLIVHRSLVHSGEVKVSDRVQASVATDLRRATVANHSATHLLQWALRQVLGPHVSQSGSLVDAQRLRFDFTHFSPITPQELRRIEDLVNEKIMEDVDVDARILRIEEAKSKGAIALFGEKYGDDVRLVSIGDFSKELCGGTHARRTGELGVFKITGETGIAAGVRRIEAVTGRQALVYFRSLEDELRILSERLRGSRGDLVSKLDKLLEGRKQAERELEQLKLKVAGKVAGDILEGCQEKNGIRVLTRIVQDVQTPKDLREYADKVRDKIGTGIALMGAVADGKAMIVAMVTKDLIPQYHAGNLVKKAAEIVGGSGGGRPDMAQAGGPDVSKLQQALESALEAV
ncbi:MAG: alanyl-tRNA synthetase [Thermodesulfobacteriota bacterium]|nr:alanyl-tRNA synthetase [Thermodesulfobacteriota bacterium]